MPFAHKNFFQVRHWWLKLRYKRQDAFVFFTLLLEGLFPVLNFWITPIEEFFFEVFSVFFSKSSFEEFVLKSLKASPFTKPLFTPGGWHKVKCVYWKVSVGLKCVRKSSTESFLNLSPLYTVVCKNVVSVSDISAVNLIVAWCLSACSMNLAISSLLTKMLSKNLFQTSGFVSLRLRISVSTLAMKMLAKLQTF